MFLAAAVFVVLALIATVIALRVFRALWRGLTGKKSGPEKKKDRETEKSTESAKKAPREKQERKEEKQPEEDVPEETRRRYAASLFNGISEAFSDVDTSFRIDGKALADECVSRTSLSFLEYNNRELAGEDFHGFNLIVEEDSRMALTYGGSAVATLTKVEREATAVINGETVIGTMPAYRTNTFPPELKPGMVVADVERMLEASEFIKGCAEGPAAVSGAMVGYFIESDNVVKLKGAVDRKIQAKESARKSRNTSRKAKHSSPLKLS